MGPFTIEEKVSAHAYRLRLPPRIGIHPVQPISLVEPAANDPFPGQRQAPPPPVQGPDGLEYRIQEILDSRYNARSNGRLEYLVAWEGHHEPSWEPATNLEEAEAVDTFY